MNITYATQLYFTRDRNREDFVLVFRLFFLAYSVMKYFVALIFVCIVLAEMQCDIQNPVVCGFKGKTNRA